MTSPSEAAEHMAGSSPSKAKRRLPKKITREQALEWLILRRHFGMTEKELTPKGCFREEVSNATMYAEENLCPRLPKEIGDVVISVMYRTRFYKDNVVFKIEARESDGGDLQFVTTYSYTVTNCSWQDQEWTADYGCDLNVAEVSAWLGDCLMALQTTLAKPPKEIPSVYFKAVLKPNAPMIVQFKARELLPVVCPGRRASIPYLTTGAAATGMTMIVNHGKAPNYDFDAVPQCRLKPSKDPVKQTKTRIEVKLGALLQNEGVCLFYRRK